jgi:hypothetical protein
MMIGRDSPLAYRRFYNIAARDEIDDISERDGSVHLLTGPEAWEKAIINLREAGGGIFDVGIEILHADARMVGANIFVTMWVQLLMELTLGCALEQGKGGAELTARQPASQNLLF